MQETGNYKLKKPAGTDIVNIDDLNANSDIIDSELAKKAQKEHTHADYANQDAFSNVIVEDTIIDARNATDNFTLAAGSNITLKADEPLQRVTISATDTKYTHPGYTKKANGLYKVTVNETGHVSATSAVTKEDITNFGIPELSDITPDAIGAFDTNCNKFDNKKNFDTYTTAGQYRVFNNANIGLPGSPEHAYSTGVLLVFTSKSTTNIDYECVTQLYICDIEDSNYPARYRIKDGDRWSNWYRLYMHSDAHHIPPYGSEGQILKWRDKGMAEWVDSHYHIECIDNCATAGWTQATGGYWKTGMPCYNARASDEYKIFIVPVTPDIEIETAKAIAVRKAFKCIDYIKPIDRGLYLYCYTEKPTISFNFYVYAIR